MNGLRKVIVVALGVFFAFVQFVAAQAAEPIAVKKYTVYTLLIPFNARLLGIDDSGDIAAVMSTGGGFIYHNGDTVIEPWSVPGSDAIVTPIAMNGRGEVVVTFGRPQTGVGIAPWHAFTYVYSAQQRTYRPFTFAPQQTKTCDGPVVAHQCRPDGLLRRSWHAQPRPRGLIRKSADGREQLSQIFQVSRARSGHYRGRYE